MDAGCSNESCDTALAMTTEAIASMASPRWTTIETVDRMMTPLWYVIGIPGNVAAYVVWIQAKMRPSSGCYLAALAMGDCLFLILQMLYELQTRWDVSLLLHPGVCESFPVFFLTTQYLSPLLVFGFTVERYISVCHPFQRQRYCTTRRAMFTITATVGLALALHAVQGYFWKFYPDTAGTGTCSVRPEVTAGDMTSVWSVWSLVTELLVFGAIPLAILILNVLVIKEMRVVSTSEISRMTRLISRSTYRHSSVRSSAGRCQEGGPLVCSNRGRSSSSSSRLFRSSATTFMLLAVSFYFIATTLPVTVCYVLYLRFPQGDPTIPSSQRFSDEAWSSHFTYRDVRTVVEEFGMSHYACNFYIYLATGRCFRRQLRRLFAKLVPCCRALSDGDWSTQSARVASASRLYNDAVSTL